MQLTLKRKYKKDQYTIGNLYINGTWFCNTLEDKDRGLSSTMSYAQIAAKKVKDKTAIPIGIYTIQLNVYSPRFGSKPYYIKTCNGYLPRLIDVPCYEGVLIHVGNTAEDTSGCILVGENKAVGKVLNSKEVFERLYKILKEASKKEIITIKIE